MNLRPHLYRDIESGIETYVSIHGKELTDQEKDSLKLIKASVTGVSDDKLMIIRNFINSEVNKKLGNLSGVLSNHIFAADVEDEANEEDMENEDITSADENEETVDEGTSDTILDKITNMIDYSNEVIELTQRAIDSTTDFAVISVLVNTKLAIAEKIDKFNEFISDEENLDMNEVNEEIDNFKERLDSFSEVISGVVETEEGQGISNNDEDITDDLSVEDENEETSLTESNLDGIVSEEVPEDVETNDTNNEELDSNTENDMDPVGEDINYDVEISEDEDVLDTIDTKLENIDDILDDLRNSVNDVSPEISDKISETQDLLNQAEDILLDDKFEEESLASEEENNLEFETDNFEDDNADFEENQDQNEDDEQTVEANRILSSIIGEDVNEDVGIDDSFSDDNEEFEIEDDFTDETDISIDDENNMDSKLSEILNIVNDNITELKDMAETDNPEILEPLETLDQNVNDVMDNISDFSEDGNYNDNEDEELLDESDNITEEEVEENIDEANQLLSSDMESGQNFENMMTAGKYNKNNKVVTSNTDYIESLNKYADNGDSYVDNTEDVADDYIDNLEKGAGSDPKMDIEHVSNNIKDQESTPDKNGLMENKVIEAGYIDNLASEFVEGQESYTDDLADLVNESKLYSDQLDDLSLDGENPKVNLEHSSNNIQNVVTEPDKNCISKASNNIKSEVTQPQKSNIGTGELKNNIQTTVPETNSVSNETKDNKTGVEAGYIKNLAKDFTENQSKYSKNMEKQVNVGKYSSNVNDLSTNKVPTMDMENAKNNIKGANGDKVKPVVSNKSKFKESVDLKKK